MDSRRSRQERKISFFFETTNQVKLEKPTRKRQEKNKSTRQVDCSLSTAMIEKPPRMVKNLPSARPPQPHIGQRRFVPINLYQDFNSHSKELINDSIGCLPKENNNYHLDDLNWQDLLATVNQRQETSKLVKVTPVQVPGPLPPPSSHYLPPSASVSSPPPHVPKSASNLYHSASIKNKTNIKYPINVDPNPQIVHRRSEKKLEYTQEVAVRYLKPQTPQPPGDIIIKLEIEEKHCFCC